jgi:glutamine phosphoribosylpyrophosphate amidotransferase
MCGIAGLFHPATPKPVDPARLRAMIGAQAHRGPDGQGIWTAPGVGFAHARLSIIDVAGSPQPMVDGEVAVCFNGEIYNYRELREELRARGAVFRPMATPRCCCMAGGTGGRRCSTGWSACSPSPYTTRRRGRCSWRATGWG